jgi:hypothetical protein
VIQIDNVLLQMDDYARLLFSNLGLIKARIK